jgi:hypothetical protein
LGSSLQRVRREQGAKIIFRVNGAWGAAEPSELAR